MTVFRLVFQNLRHFAPSWALTLMAVIIGTAVLTGALITGDSVRYSLSEQVATRLGKTRFALSSPDRFFRQALASEMANTSGLQFVPILQTRGIVSEPAGNFSLFQANIIGVNKDFAKLWTREEEPSEFISPMADEVVVSANVAQKLHVRRGDFLVIKFSREGFVTANAPFVSMAYGTNATRIKIKAVISDKSGGRFSLDNNQSAPFNIFVSLKLLAEKMAVPGYSNTLLVATNNRQTNTDSLGNLLRRTWAPEDAGLRITALAPGLVQLDSRRVFIEDTLAGVIRKSFIKPIGILTYLVNEISVNGHSAPYSFVTAADSGISPAFPGKGKTVINNWLAQDLHAKPGDSLTLRYWIPGASRSLSEVSSKFLIQSIVPVGENDADRALMPDFPGIKNMVNCRDWETGTPISLDRIRDTDEKYWNLYRGTPKAWISLADGQKIWKNHFGRITAFRTCEDSAKTLLTEKMHELDPAAIGLIFKPVFEDGLRAATGSTDFGELFLSLGGLICIAGLMLSGMLLSFFLKQRAEEMTLMRALGFRTRKILAVLLSETMIVAIAGGFLGTITAIIYAWLIVKGLNTLWLKAVNTSGLIVCIQGITLFQGFITGMILNLVVFSTILFRNRKRSLPSYYDQPEPKIPGKRSFRRFSEIAVIVCLFGSAIVIHLTESLSGRFYPSTTFLISGILVMAGIIAGISFFLKWSCLPEMKVRTRFSQHVIRNITLHKLSSLTAISLLALGTFTLLVTSFNRKSIAPSETRMSAGTGGFLLWMETTIPVFADLNTTEGRKKFGLEDEPLPGNIRFIPLPGIQGDDASCLNLNQVKRPALTGVPANLFDQRRSFSFENLAHGVDQAHPWKALDQVDHPSCINGYADQTVITYGLHKQVGDTLQYTDESGRPLNIRLTGGLANSVFQGRILISDKLMNRYFPSSVRTHSMLIDAPAGSENAVIPILEERLRDQGALIIRTEDKLAAFAGVENTYLDVFIILGGFGLVIGTAGLAVMLMRNLRERRRELVLFTALGFPYRMTYRMLAGEFLFILIAGIFTGIVSAIAGSWPSLARGGAGMLCLPVILTFIILINGLLWIHFPIRNILSSIRKEPVTKLL